jgi:hypothetical protein
MEIGVGLPNAIPDVDRDSLHTHQVDELAGVVGK